MMKRILIIDDDAAIRLLYEEELCEEGYDIISSDGEKGLLHLIAAKRPDLILLDVKLRSRSGLSLLRDIRNAFHGIPVILTTAYPAFQIGPKSFGADAYVTKNSDRGRTPKQQSWNLRCSRACVFISERKRFGHKKQVQVNS